MIPLPYLLLGAVAMSALAGYYGYQEGSDDVYAEWDKAKLEVEQAYSAKLKEAAEHQQQLDVTIENLRLTYAKDKGAADKRIADLTERLSNRPSRIVYKDRPVSDTSCVIPDPTGCTGAELYREDSLAFGREAARADTAVALLRECRDAYDTIRTAILDRNGEE